MSMDELPPDIEQRVLSILEGENPTAALETLCKEEPEWADRIKIRVDRARRIQAKIDELVMPGNEPDFVGPYRILSRIAEGGMGVVYLAEQSEPVRRHVALKLIKPGFNTERILSRFDSERQALARMSHPCIANVFDAGITEAHRPWFTMEYVPGESLTSYCDQKQLDIPARLALFRLVCSAVQHAHQKGVIHRDLKPANVLVTEEGGQALPKVIDFGLARATEVPLTEGGMPTIEGVMLGTPEYMSPEQATGESADIDTRTDVYALGAMLYELLTGQLPIPSETLRSTTRAELLVKLTNQDPQRPSSRVLSVDDSSALKKTHRTEARTLARQLRGDLDWITLKALEKNRERRYQSPRELAEDIERTLGHKPVLAGPPTLYYRSQKLWRRYRIQISAVVVGFVSLVVALGISLSALSEARSSQETAQLRAQEAEKTTDFLVGLFEAASPEQSLGGELPVHILLNEGIRRIREEEGMAIALKARLLATLGLAQLRLGGGKAAAELLTTALSIETAATSSQDRANWRLLLAEAYLMEGDFDRMEKEMGLAQWSKTDAEAATFEAHSLILKGKALHARGKIAQARVALEKARRLLGDPRKDVKTWSISLLSQATIEFSVGSYEKSRELLVEARSAMADQYPAGHPQLIRIEASLLSPLLKLGRVADAEEALARAEDMAARILDAQHPLHADLALLGAQLYKMTGQVAKAEAALRRALSVFESLLPASHPRIAWCCNDLGALLVTMNRAEEALPLLERAHKMYATLHKTPHADTARALHNLADAYRSMWNLKEAERIARESLQMREELASPQMLAVGQRLLGWILISSGRAKEAEKVLRRSIATWGDATEDIWERGLAHSHLMLALNIQKKHNEARTEGLKALELLDKAMPRDHRMKALSLYNLGWAALGARDMKEAERRFTASIAMFDRLFPNGDQEALFPLTHWGNVLLQTRPKDALPILERAGEIAIKLLPKTNARRQNTLFQLATARQKLGHLDDAEDLLKDLFVQLLAQKGAKDRSTIAVQKRLTDIQKSRKD